MSLLQVLSVLSAATDAQKRIPLDLRGTGWTWFSSYDLWLYEAVTTDRRTCFPCMRWHRNTLPGSIIRGLFEWLEVVDMYTVLPRVHKNCRCVLHRY